MKQRNNMHLSSRQHGAVLFIAIILLLVMTLIGASAMKLTTSQERQAGIIQDIELAFQTTETNLRGGEQIVSDLAAAPIPKTSPVDSSNGGVYSIGPTVGGKVYHEWMDASHAAFVTAAQGTATITPTDPIFIIEEIAIVSDVLNLGDPPTQVRHFYRITASGTGQDVATHTLLQSTYAEAY